MKTTELQFRIAFARLLGLCSSAEGLKEYGVPKAWTDELMQQAERCEELFKLSNDGSSNAE